MKILITLITAILFFNGCSNLNLVTPNVPNKQTLISNAQQGNINAMIELNEYYSFPQTKEGYDYYNKWFELVLKNKNPKDILAFRETFDKNFELFVNWRIKKEQLLIAAKNLNERETLFDLIQIYIEDYQKEKSYEIEKEILSNADINDYFKLFEIYYKLHRYDYANNIADIIKNKKLDTTMQGKVILIKTTYKENPQDVNKLLNDVFASNNSELILNCADFLKSSRKYKEAIKFYEKLETLNKANVEIYLSLSQCYKIIARSEKDKYQNKVIENLEKSALLNNYEGTKSLLKEYTNDKKYYDNYINIKDKLIKLTKSKLALAEFYYQNDKKTQGNKLFSQLAEIGNQDVILQLASRNQTSHDFNPEEDLLIKKWQNYILNSNSPNLITQYTKKITDNRFKFKELTEIREKLIVKIIEQQNILAMKEIIKAYQSKDKERSLEYLKMTVLWGDVSSAYELGGKFIYDKDPEKFAEGIKVYEDLAQRGEIEVLRTLAEIFIYPPSSKDEKKDLKKGIYYYEKASELGDKHSTKKLSNIYICGECNNKKNDEIVDYKKAKFYNEKLAKQNDNEAYNNLAWLYHTGNGVEKDLDKAAEYYNKSGLLGNSDGYYSAAWVYYDSEKKDYKKAFEYLQKGVEVDNLQCLNLLGIFYEKGYAVEKDMNKAISYYKRAAQYNAYAANNLGKYYRKQKEYEKALKYLNHAKEKGNTNAMIELGIMYEEGTGVKKDINEAINNYTNAYQIVKDVNAAYNLGLIYQYGKGGVKKDFKLAKKWYELSNTQDAKEKIKKLN